MTENIKFLGKTHKPDIRKIGDLKDVVFDKKWFKETKKDIPAYFMYRGLIKKPGLRYDITIIPFRPFGQELPKTLGHYHSFARPTKYRFPELYEVINGNAIFLLQKLSTGKIKRVLIISAKSGDRVILPPGYGHITMNAGPGPLKLANWMAVKSYSNYKLIVRKNGGAYFALRSGGKIKLVKNKKYDRLPEPEHKKASDFTPSFLRNKELPDLSKNYSSLEFLKNPKKLAAVWKELEN